MSLRVFIACDDPTCETDTLCYPAEIGEESSEGVGVWLETHWVYSPPGWVETDFEGYRCPEHALDP